MSRSKIRSGKETSTGSADDKKPSMERNLENRGHPSIIDLLRPASYPMSIPDRNGNRLTGELSRDNELPNVFPERPQWLKPLHENILQAGQHFCPNDFLEGSGDTWRKVFGYIEILHHGKWK